MNDDKITLACTPVNFYSQLDADALCEWIEKIGCISDIKNVNNEIHFSVVSKNISDNELREIIALFNRYRFDYQQLAIFFDGDAERDFKSPGNWEGKMGKLPDGRIAIVRSISSTNRPILETFDLDTGKKTVIRYDKNKVEKR